MHSYRVLLAMILKSVFSLKKMFLKKKNWYLPKKFKTKNIFKSLKNYILENHFVLFSNQYTFKEDIFVKNTSNKIIVKHSKYNVKTNPLKRIMKKNQKKLISLYLSNGNSTL